MEPFADMMCELKVDIHCETCKMKMMEVLSSISGVYSVTIDAKGGKVKVDGQVDPNILLRALARTDRHAELIWVKLKHPQVGRGGSSYDHSFNHGDYSYGPRNYLFEPMGSNRYGSRGPGLGPWAGRSWYEPPDHYPHRSPYVDHPFSRGRCYNFGPYIGPRW